MKIAVLIKQVPDLVEGLEIDAGGKALDQDSLRYIISEADDHALEQALLIRERTGASVDVFTLDVGEARDSLTTALAKGAERVTLLAAGLEAAPGSHALAELFAGVLRPLNFDLIVTGVRAIDDLDGSLGGLLAGLLELPYVGLIRKVETGPGGETVIVQKEFPGGFITELEVKLPAVLGIQSAEQPPRYVPVSRLRQVMKTAKIGEQAVEAPQAQPIAIERLFKPEEGAGASMLEGTPEELAKQIAGLLAERHLLKG